MLKILIVDDDEIILLVQKKLLQRCGVKSDIFSFREGQKALQFLREERETGEYLILLDINMPHMNGWQFLEFLDEAELPHKIFVIMVTSSINSSDKEFAKGIEKVIGFEEKPVTVDNCDKIKKMPQLKKYF